MPFQLPTQEQKAEYVREQFNRIAARYDLANDAISFGMHRLWKARAVHELCQPGGDSFLDVCCGTGDLALTISRYLRRSGQVTGIDFSQNMLDVADQRSKKEEENTGARASLRKLNIQWLRGDAQNLPCQDNTFDGAIISFGLRNLTDLPRGISEMCRVVKGGGRVVNLDLGHSTVPLFAPLFRFYFSCIVPIIGELLQGDRQAYTYLPQSLTTYPKPEKITQIFVEAGLQDVRHIPLAMGSVALHVGTKPLSGEDVESSATLS
jgi:demethylmenaquinone methyltransferase/2-methoxy-6-polyprenyl-1,4-benzoquinol methylase